MGITSTHEGSAVKNHPVSVISSSGNGSAQCVAPFARIPQEVWIKIFTLAKFTNRQVISFGLVNWQCMQISQSREIWIGLLRVDFIFYHVVRSDQNALDPGYISKEKVDFIKKRRETYYIKELKKIYVSFEGQSMKERLKNLKPFFDKFGGDPLSITDNLSKLHEPLPEWTRKWRESQMLSRKDYDRAMQELFEAFGGRALDFAGSLSKLYDSLPTKVAGENVDYHVYRLIHYVAARCVPQEPAEVDIHLFPLKDLESFRRYYRVLSVFIHSCLDGSSENTLLMSQDSKPVNLSGRKSQYNILYVVLMVSLFLLYCYGLPKWPAISLGNQCHPGA